MGCLRRSGGSLLPSQFRSLFGQAFVEPRCADQEVASALLNIFAGIEGCREKGLVEVHYDGAIKTLRFTDEGAALAEEA